MAAQAVPCHGAEQFHSGGILAVHAAAGTGRMDKV